MTNTIDNLSAEINMVKSICEKLQSCQPLQPKLKNIELVEKTSNKFKCRVCDFKFEGKGELKEHWDMGEIFCKPVKNVVLQM